MNELKGYTFSDFEENYKSIISDHRKFKIKEMWPSTNADITYKVVSNKQEFISELQRLNQKLREGGIYFSLRLEGIIVDFPINDLDDPFMIQIDNVIFLEKVTLSSSLREKLTKSEVQVRWNNCYFMKEFKIQTFDWHMLEFLSCKFYGNVTVSNLRLEAFQLRNCEFRGTTYISNSYLNRLEMAFINADSINMSSTRTNADCILSNLNIKELKLTKSKILGTLSIVNNQEHKCETIDLENAYCKKFILNTHNILHSLNLCRFIIEGDADINLDNISAKKYKALMIRDYNGKFDRVKTLESINCLLRNSLIKSNTDEYLVLLFLSNRIRTSTLIMNNESLLGKVLKLPEWSLAKLIEVTTKYFTSWKASLLTIFILLLGFTLVYALNPQDIILNNQSISEISLTEMIFAKRDISTSSILNLIGICFYFSIITFTTIGYGDISPSGNIRIVAGIEGLLGVLMIAIFITCLTRKYLR